MDPKQAVRNYIKACGKGVLKIMSKMGVSTVASYTGAQIFEAIGLGKPVVDAYFTGTVSQLGGIGLDEIAAEVAARHAMANPTRPEERAHRKLELGGEYQWRREGELHLFNPETVFKLQHATRSKRYDIFKEYTSRVDDQSEKLMTLRGLFEFATATRVDSARRGGTRQRDRQAVLDRRDELRLDLGRGPRDAGHRHEPPRREVEHGRGRRGRRPAVRPGAALVDQAGRIGPVRGDLGVPDQRRRPADQDGSGSQARRGRPAPRSQGVSVDRGDASLDARRRPHQPATAPRHLLDRGSQAADPRSEERQPGRPRAREAGRGERRRNRRRRGVEGQGGRRADLRSRRRNRREPAHLAQACRRALGAGARGDPADAAAQRAARPDRRADRRPDEDRTRRRSSRRCSAPRSTGSPRRRSSCRAAS